jgi:ABC-type branched-subunit amino acid transport system ATPase component
MLTATKLNKSFGGVQAVNNASFRAKTGLITALIGPNGAGKTTLFNLISGTMNADQGLLEFNGRDIANLSCEHRARLGMSRTFQLARPFRNLTIREHMLLAMDDKDDVFWRSIFAHDSLEADDRITKLLKRIGLDIDLDTPADSLSYGQGKLLGIAIALIHPHRILLMDEPVAGVNPVLREQISNLLLELRQRSETILIIEHDMEFVMSIADHVIVLDRGAVIAEGKPEEIQKNPAVLNAYLGEQL